MPALQVRDFPATLYDELRRYAAANHRSIAQQTIIAVEEMLAAVETPALSDDVPEQNCLQAFGNGPTSSRRLGASWAFGRTVSEECIQRRRRIFADFDAIDWRGAPSTTEDIVAFISEGRNERIDRILASVDSPDFD